MGACRDNGPVVALIQHIGFAFKSLLMNILDFSSVDASVLLLLRISWKEHAKNHLDRSKSRTQTVRHSSEKVIMQ